MEKIIGKCSSCGGRVVLHIGPWFGVNPPEPYCKDCGAERELPTIKMGKARRSNFE